MTNELIAKIILGAIILAVSFLPIWSKWLPYNLCGGRDPDGRWHWWIERKDR